MKNTTKTKEHEIIFKEKILLFINQSMINRWCDWNICTKEEEKKSKLAQSNTNEYKPFVLVIV